MKMHRVWIEIVVLVTGIACALAFLLATLGAGAGAVVSRAGKAQTNPPGAEQGYEGMVTCSRCGARHSAALARTADVCVRVCVHGGASFALVNADATYLLEGDTDALRKVAGQRARIVGNLNGKTIRVASVAAAG